MPVLGSLAGEALPAPFPEEGRAVQPQATVRSDLPPVLDVTGLTTRFEMRRWFRLAGRIHAVEQVTLTVRHGETLALVGEFGLRQVHHRTQHHSAGAPAGRRDQAE